MNMRKAAILAAASLAAGVIGSIAYASASVPGKQTQKQLVARGERLFTEKTCWSCHGPGIGNPGLAYKPGTDALRVKYEGSLPAVLSERTDLTPEYIGYVVRNGVTLMPFFRKTDVSDEELAAISAYLTRNNDVSAKKAGK